MDGTFQSVVGQIPSPSQTLLSKTGKTFRVDYSGQISGPDRHHIPPGCVRAFSPTPTRATATSGRSQLVQPAHGKAPPKGDALLIGEIPSPDTAIFSGPVVVVNASDGPSGLYVVPDHCDDGRPVRALTTAASAVASTGGNPFALAGNRGNLRDGLHTKLLTSGDVELTP
ncbi:hypothetical protein AA106555_0410 [Neokomagataea thailandica NBRC 106555]|nr:hypothetical protein AA106555_0410 [Neokomagataea thailandica NBRC 106555]